MIALIILQWNKKPPTIKFLLKSIQFQTTSLNISWQTFCFSCSVLFSIFIWRRVHLNSCFTFLTWIIACWQGSRYLGICHGMLKYLWLSDRCLPAGFWLERNSKEHMEKCWLDSPPPIFISQSCQDVYKAWSCSPRILQCNICMCFSRFQIVISWSLRLSEELFLAWY